MTATLLTATVSVEKLRGVYEREKPYRPNWPDSFDACMADPLISRTLALRARHELPAVQRRSWQGPHIAAAPAPQRHQPRPLDGKALASGERPEPD